MVDIRGLMEDLRWPKETYEDLKGPYRYFFGEKIPIHYGQQIGTFERQMGLSENQKGLID